MAAGGGSMYVCTYLLFKVAECTALYLLRFLFILEVSGRRKVAAMIFL